MSHQMCNFASGHGFDIKQQVFGHGESFGTIFRSLRSTWRPRTGWRGCRRSRSTSRSEILTQLLSIIETWFWWQNQCFGIWGIIWDHFQKPPDQPDGQELGEGAVGGQEQTSQKSRARERCAVTQRHLRWHILVIWDLFFGACHFCSFETVDLATF